ncbi:MAG: GIY-YIG nuclease family protein [Myxococcota bacterium]
MPQPERRFIVYLLRCGDGSLYAGITDRLAARVAAHGAGKAARYTRSRLPVALVWHKGRQTATDARRLEWALKQQPRDQKLRLVAGDETVWRRLRRKLGRSKLGRV